MVKQSKLFDKKVAEKRKVNRLSTPNQSKLINFILDKGIINQPVAEIFKSAKAQFNFPLTIHNVSGAKLAALTISPPAPQIGKSDSLIAKINRLEKQVAHLYNLLGEKAPA